MQPLNDKNLPPISSHNDTSALHSLEQTIKNFEEEIERHNARRAKAKERKSEELQELQEDYEERINLMVSKIE